METSAEERREKRQEYRASVLLQFQQAASNAEFTYARDTKRFVTTATTEGASGAAVEAVQDKQVRAALDEAIDSAEDEVRALTSRLVNGEVTLAEWQQTMSQYVKSAHLNAGALSKGGFENLTQRDYGQIGGRIADELEYLRGFAQDISDGTQALDGTALRRSEMYMGKVRKTHHKLHRREMQKIGYNQERNVLGVAEHCEECVALTNRGDADGWVPNGTLTPIGDRICLSNCKCRIEYRNTDTTDPSRFPSVRE